MYKRITATGSPAIAIAETVFKRPPDLKEKKGKHVYPSWLNPTPLESMQLASKSRLGRVKSVWKVGHGHVTKQERWEVVPKSSFWMTPGNR